MDVKYRAALREVAEAAKEGSWSITPYDADGHYYSVGPRTAHGVSPIAECLDESHAFHIAAFDPATVLAMLDHIEALEKKLAGRSKRSVAVAPAERSTPTVDFTGCAGVVSIGPAAV